MKSSVSKSKSKTMNKYDCACKHEVFFSLTSGCGNESDRQTERMWRMKMFNV